LTGSEVAVSADPAAIATARSTIEAMCPCAAFDGTAGKSRGSHQQCANGVVDALVAGGLLRAECRSTLRRLSATSVCGRKTEAEAMPCVRRSATGKVSCTIKAPAERCEDRPGVYEQSACELFTHCIDAADSNGDLLIDASDDGRCRPAATPSPAPAMTPPPSPVPTQTPAPTPPGEPQPYPTGANGARLAELVNEYRVARGKAPIPLSPALMAVAGAHVYDLLANPNILTATCNLHSWSTSSSLWSGCCYDANHSQASCMWSKPSQISSALGYTRYPGNGYEITYRGWFATPEMVMEFFENSPGHREVILNQGAWASYSPFPAMGAAMRGDFAVVWFGNAPDPQD